MKWLQGFVKNQRLQREGNYNRRHSVQDRMPLSIGQNVVVRESGKPSIQANMVTTQGREIVVVGSSGRLFRHNRHMVRPIDDQSPMANKDKEDIGSRATQTTGVVAPEVTTGVGTWPQSTSEVAPPQSTGVVAPEVTAGVVAPVIQHTDLIPDTSKEVTISTRINRQPAPMTSGERESVCQRKYTPIRALSSKHYL